MAPIERLTDKLEAPALDDRSYRVIRLPNKLEALLVHDSDIDKAGAAVSVNVGSFSDADDTPGIAHAVEHLLFEGTKKYPKENDFNEYLSAHSGYSNAYTEATEANYYFEVAASTDSESGKLTNDASISPLYGALDRFAQFFISPLFLSSTLGHELKAVDLENKKNLQSDDWRLSQLSKSLSSKETLRDESRTRGVDVRKEFLQSHNKYYSANRIKLVVLGKESLDELETWVGKLFASVHNQDLPQKRALDRFAHFLISPLSLSNLDQVSSRPRQARSGESVPTDIHDAHLSIDERIGPKTLTGLPGETIEHVPPIEFQKHLKSLDKKYRGKSSGRVRYGADTNSVYDHNDSECFCPNSKRSRLYEPPQMDLEAKPKGIAQPKTELLTREDLIVEVKVIYAGRVMVDTQFTGIDESHSATAQAKVPPQRRKLSDNQRQSIIELHKQSLHKDHALFLASQYPCTSPALSKYRIAGQGVLKSRYATSILHSWRRRISCLRSLLFVPFIASCPLAVVGSPIGSVDDANKAFTIFSSVHLLVGSLYVGFTAAALATAHSLAIKWGPIRVWGSMMGISAYGWWVIMNDATAPPALSITNVGFWAVSAFRYGHTTFRQFRIPERALLIILLGALMLDMATVRFMTPTRAPLTQDDLLSLSLPAMSLSLAITANIFSYFQNQPASPPPSHETAIEHSAIGRDPYIGGSFQQTSFPDLGTSRPYLLGSPLNEDSTRIWENDD